MWHNGGSDCNVVDNLQGVKRFIDPGESFDREGRNRGEFQALDISALGLFERRAPSLSLSFSLPRRFSPSQFILRLDWIRAPFVSRATIDHDHPCAGICWGKWLSVGACNRGFGITRVCVVPGCKFDDETRDNT